MTRLDRYNVLCLALFAASLHGGVPALASALRASDTPHAFAVGQAMQAALGASAALGAALAYRAQRRGRSAVTSLAHGLPLAVSLPFGHFVAVRLAPLTPAADPASGAPASARLFWQWGESSALNVVVFEAALVPIVLFLTSATLRSAETEKTPSLSLWIAALAAVLAGVWLSGGTSLVPCAASLLLVVAARLGDRSWALGALPAAVSVLYAVQGFRQLDEESRTAPGAEADEQLLPSCLDDVSAQPARGALSTAARAVRGVLDAATYARLDAAHGDHVARVLVRPVQAGLDRIDLGAVENAIRGVTCAEKHELRLEVARAEPRPVDLRIVCRGPSPQEVNLGLDGGADLGAVVSSAIVQAVSHAPILAAETFRFVAPTSAWCTDPVVLADGVDLAHDDVPAHFGEGRYLLVHGATVTFGEATRETAHETAHEEDASPPLGPGH